MTQSGKSEEDVIKLIKEAKKQKEASKSWADYDPNEPFDPSDIPEFYDILPKRIKNKPPQINTNVGKILNPVLYDKNELYNILMQHLNIHHPEYSTGQNLDKILEHTLNYLQELNNNTQLPQTFINSIKRFIYQFKPSQPEPTVQTTSDIVHLPDIHDQPHTVTEDILTKHIQEIIKEHSDILDFLTTRHVMKILEGKLHTNLHDYKSFIKQTIKENLPKTPSPKLPSPKLPSPKISMEELFGTPTPSPKVEEEIEIEPPKSPKRKSKQPKSKSKKAKSVKRKSVKKSKSVKRKSVKKSKSKKAKSVKKSKSKSKKAKSVKRKSVKKSKSKSKKAKSKKSN